MNGDVKDLKEGDVFPVYLCDPEKNTVCNKNNCGEYCFWTRHKEFGLSERPVKYARVGAGENILSGGKRA